jgi:hypothetical protein
VRRLIDDDVGMKRTSSPVCFTGTFTVGGNLFVRIEIVSKREHNSLYSSQPR